MENEILEIVSSEKKTEHRVLINLMEARLNSIEQPRVLGRCCIYKVPKIIRQINEAVYTPQIVSIGPLHHGDQRLKPMEELKWGYPKDLLQRNDTKLEDIIHKLKKDEVLIRGCYAQNIPQSSDNFVSMILIDACFIIESFLRWHEVLPWLTIDPIMSKPWWKNDMRLDFILLENQLPFFVLEDLFSLTSGDTIYSSFLELSFNYFGPENEELTFDDFCEHHLTERQGNGKRVHIEVKHFTDLIRRLYLPRLGLQQKREWQVRKHLHSASQLLEAGVKFKVHENKIVRENISIIELQFAKGVLKIPQLEVSDTTETFLRNIVALEQCHYPYDAYITDYIQLLDFLINNGKDVDILVDKGIMTNLLGDSNKVAIMVNHLCIGVTLTNTSAAYIELYQKLNAFCNKPLHKYMAIFMREYFSTPWKMASFFAAIALLLLTLIQTICSIISLV